MNKNNIKEQNIANEVSFILHGDVHKIKESDNICPDTTLNDYLRNYNGLRGTKGMCYEGGCGACIVVVTIQHPITKKSRKFAVNSCLVSIFSCHGWIIDTVEGIGNRRDSYDPVQKTLAKFNGTQCGYCSPGMVMNMYALYSTNESLTMKDVENSFGGNLCRCTGYRAIMDAFKSMTVDAEPCLKKLYSEDIEDIEICKKTPEKKCSEICNFKLIEPKQVHLTFNNQTNWYKINKIDELLELISLIGNKTYRFVGGNTGKGVFPITNLPDIWIDISSVPEFIQHKLETNLILGANVTLTDAMSIFNNVADQNTNFAHLKKVYDHFNLVANVPVRNIGTIAGNLSLKHEHHNFPSDVFLLLETIKAQVEIVKSDGSVQTKSLVDYLNIDMTKSFVKSIIIPPLENQKYLFESYKICPRVQNAHAYVNAGFLLEHDNYVIKSARFVIGGINPNFVHATETEKFIVGKNITDNTTIQGMLAKLDAELKPDYILPDSTPEFRKGLATALLYKFILSIVPKSKLNSKYISGGDRLNRGLSSGLQMYDSDKNLYPLTQPISKVEALIQCSGEAQYVNDMPTIGREVFAALVLAEVKPFSKIKKIDLSTAKCMPGYVTFLDHKAIPGINSFISHPLTPTKEQLFAEDKVLYNGQPIGLVISHTQTQAIETAKAIKIVYEDSTEIPAYTVEDALKNNQTSRIKNIIKVNSQDKGKNTKHVIKGKVELGPQYHFTMETQAAICMPNDEGGLDVFSATQWMDHVQQSVSAALNMPMHKINVGVKRLGGGFGAKQIRATFAATACAIAAYNLNRPVRLILPLIDNMKCIGKRIGISSEYEVGVDDNGTIQYMKNLIYQPTGLSIMNEQLTFVVPDCMMNPYVSDTWTIEGNIVQTDMPGNAYCRAPGSVEAVCTIESIMDHISQVVNKDSVDVRKANLKPDHKNISQLIDEILEWSEYDKRKKEIDDFNLKNRWMKKGIGMALMNFKLHVFAPLHCMVSVYAKDGTVALSHAGIEMGQGLNTKAIQVCAYVLKIPLDMIQTKTPNVITCPNNMFSAASYTSEAICLAIMEACKELLNRLEPVKQKMNNPTWKELIAEAHNQGVNLCVSYMFNKDSKFKEYFIPGICVAEVTCDILTGEHLIDRVSLIEDVGQSISPSVDVGQIEGAFVMGLGYFTTENLIYNDEGKLLTNNTWTYKIPGVKDIPVDFRIKFKQNSFNPEGVLNSKSTGEPPLCLSISVPLAIRYALASARADANQSTERFIPINGPTTVEYKFLNSLNDFKKYSL